ncbi:MAG: hypothetical protein H7Z37_02080 [Pyrinomonadaceae bacterium]|nr:hypothetical protein [Pyrinomonadaceae bacterium]
MMVKLFTFFLLICSITGVSVSARNAFLNDESWTKQNVSTLSWLHKIYFLDSKQGWIAGSSGTLLATIDGGDNWKTVKLPTNDNLRDVFFSDSENGWLVCERPFFLIKSSSDLRSYILETRDGGKSWEKASFADNVNVQITRLITAPDKKMKWAVGEIGSLFSSKSETAKWEKQMSPTKFVLTDGVLFDDANGFVIGAGATALTTVDAGKTWREALLSDVSKTRFNSIAFANRQNGWIVGANGKIFVTGNGGNVWKAQNSNSTVDLHDVFFTSPKEGWITGDDGVILRTKDGGANWEKQESPTKNKLESIYFNENEGWAVGFGGSILRYKKKAINNATTFSSPNKSFAAPRVVLKDESSIKFVRVSKQKSFSRRLAPNPKVKSNRFSI